MFGIGDSGFRFRFSGIEVWLLGSVMRDSGIGVRCMVFGVQGSGFGIQFSDLDFRFSVFEVSVSGSGVQDSEFRIWCQVSGFGVGASGSVLSFGLRSRIPSLKE